MTKFTIKAAGLTDQGRVRTNNEDAVWVDAGTGLIIVADGMGGHKSGEKASGIAIQSIPENYRQLSKANTSGEVFDRQLSPETNRLGFCVKMANQLIFEASKHFPKDNGMGTTCTAAVIAGDRLGIAHVGDTRCYVIRRGEMEQLTQDHSLVMEQVRKGLITKEEAATGANQNILTRALGIHEEVQLDVEEHPLFPGDLLLFCSDGLGKEMTDAEILKVANATPDPKALAARLVDMANEHGGRDNITVAAARVEKPGFGDSIKGFFRSFGG